MLQRVGVWCYFNIPTLDFFATPTILGSWENAQNCAKKCDGALIWQAIVTKQLNKINLHTRDDRPTFWYKICKLPLTKF